MGSIQLVKTVYVGQSYLSENYKLEEARIVAERYNSGMSKAEALAGYGPYKCNFEPGTGEIIVSTFVEELEDLYETK